MAFIVDTSGLLIASSTPEPITAGAGEDTVLLRASDSSNRLIRGGVAYLRGQYQSLDQVQSSQLEFVQAKERYFLQVSRFTDDLGLDWVLVLMVPEEDFMAPIHHQNRVTFVLYVLSLLLATAFGLLLANWVIRPLHQLSDRASEIAQGNWHDPIELERSDAIGQLSRSLATMARQLKESLTTLEQRVEERNQELTQVNQELQKLAHSDGLTQTANRRYFDTVIKREWQRLSREQQPMALMLCDVDYFKRYNDTYGHQAGDQCLREVAQVLGQTSRRPADSGGPVWWRRICSHSSKHQSAGGRLYRRKYSSPPAKVDPAPQSLSHRAHYHQYWYCRYYSLDQEFAQRPAENRRSGPLQRQSKWAEQV